jgi:Flp pilus assembly pilin Flp
MTAQLKKLLVLANDQRGGALVEYVIVVALVAAVGVATWQKFGEEIEGYTDDSRTKINDELTKAP